MVRKCEFWDEAYVIWVVNIVILGVTKIMKARLNHVVVVVVVLLLLSAAPVRGRHSGSSVMIRILIWHRFYARCPC